ncbi:radical SAM protein [Nonomuraea sp. NPDC000554]|uniref:radical SAM/SPASM domain-containing protein n=1 Tax=Nonomuraea sp. NPDC000554 TaxID=3154259 RepID=UPI0033260A43
MTTIPQPALDLLCLEITGRCQLACAHCYADSGPTGTDGSMTVADWTDVIDQAADLGVRLVQFIGGEPLLYRALPTLIGHALASGLQAEVYSNLVHVSDAMWQVLAQPGVRLATSFYSDDPIQHTRITGRDTLPRTQANIGKAVRRGIPLRVGLVDLGDGQRVEQARSLLTDLGVTNLGVDRMRLLGRPALRAGEASELCGRCGDGVAAILPDGTVTPCPLGRWLSAGDVRHVPLRSLLGQVRQITARDIRPVLDAHRPCEPSCNPGCDPGMHDPDSCSPKGRCDPNQPPAPACKPSVSCKPKG